MVRMGRSRRSIVSGNLQTRRASIVEGPVTNDNVNQANNSPGTPVNKVAPAPLKGKDMASIYNSKTNKELYQPKVQKHMELNYMTTLMDNLDEYRSAFRRFAHGENKLPLHRLGNLLRYLGLNPTESEVEDLKNEIDEDQNGFIDMNEFVQMVQDQFAGQDNDEELLEILFSQIDTTGRGSMSLDEIKNAIEQCKSLVNDESEQEKLRELILAKKYESKYDDHLEGIELSRFQRLKKWALEMFETLKRYHHEIMNTFRKTPQNQLSRDHAHPQSPESRQHSRKGSQTSMDREKTKVTDEEQNNSIWLTKSEIEEMVREFDIEGQGRFDTGAFIKAWRDLNSGM